MRTFAVLAIIATMLVAASFVHAAEAEAERPRPIVVHGWRMYRVKVRGRMYSDNIFATCKQHGMMPACDHPSYVDGRCALIRKRNVHFSHPSHAQGDVPRSTMYNTFFYCGRANGQRSLYNTGRSHRWSNNNDRNGYTFCTLPPRKPNWRRVLMRYHGLKVHKVRVNGLVNSDSILSACRRHRLIPACNHQSYADGRCALLIRGGRHLSYNRHHSLNRNKLDRTFTYCGRANHGRALQNWRNTHRWSGAGDFYGDTLCVEKPRQLRPRVEFKRYGWRFYRQIVMGVVTSDRIRQTCRRIHKMPVCDHPNYYDGNCAVLMKRKRHFSHRSHHDLDQNRVDRTFWYAGRANHGKALQNWHNTHRWSTHGDMFGEVFCVAPPRKTNSRRIVARWNGFNFHKVRVTGGINSHKIYEACKRAGLKTPCDHHSYADGKCINVNNPGRHMSYPRHQDFPRNVGDRMFWYCGRANGGKSLQTYRNTHRWSSGGDVAGYTLCISLPRIRRHYLFTSKGYGFYKFRVRGDVNSYNIRQTCNRRGMLTPCDHPNYADGRCVSYFKAAKHLSYPRHHSLDRSKLDGVNWYCGRANHGRALRTFSNTHRWTTAGDRFGYTVCLTPPKETNPYRVRANWNGWRFAKVLVKNTMNSYNIGEACRSYKLQIPCDHHSYYDGKCIKINRNGRHMSYNRHHSFPRSVSDRTYWYCGRANGGRSLQNWHNTHRWNKAGDMWGYTLCLVPKNWSNNKLSALASKWKPAARKYKLKWGGRGGRRRNHMFGRSFGFDMGMFNKALPDDLGGNDLDNLDLNDGKDDEEDLI
jgi:hypothetical protein